MQRVTQRPSLFDNLIRSVPTLRETMARGNLALLRSLLGPAYRGLILQTANGNDSTDMALGFSIFFAPEARRRVAGGAKRHRDSRGNHSLRPGGARGGIR